VDGKSLLPMMKGEVNKVRDTIHGECAAVATLQSGMQFITSEKYKYVYFPGLGTEQFFDLETDPDEMVNYIDDPRYATLIHEFREILIQELENRPENFVTNGKLNRLEKGSAPCYPEYESQLLEWNGN